MSAGPNKKVLSLGSNLGDRFQNLQKTCNQLESICKIEKVSPIYETNALVKDEHNPGFPFLNLVLQIETTDSALVFLDKIKFIEKKLGRKNKGQWFPRTIDIDILYWDKEVINTQKLSVPHPQILNRSFILAPLKDLYPVFLKSYREQRNTHMSLMKIYNITPDSFSDGGKNNELSEFKLKLQSDYLNGVNIIDLGAESTRPGAKKLSPDQEWSRLAPFISEFHDTFKHEPLRPQLSVDTYHSQNMARSLEYGVDIINDVSGCSNSETLNLLSNSEVDYVLMHSLDIPAVKNNFIKEPIIPYLKNWLDKKLNLFEKNNISYKRIIFDPGIGFGKTANQSIQIIRYIDEFKDYPVRVLIGHSRKSFLSSITDKDFQNRDALTLGASMALLDKKVDILRLHNTEVHTEAIRAYNYVNCKSH